MKHQLTAEELRAILDYNHQTGEFTWKVRPRCMFKSDNSYATFITRFSGKRAGNEHRGYRTIRTHQHNYFEHRLAWLHAYGEWPTNTIDHINGNGLDNRLSNLRDVIHQVNCQNKRGPYKKKSNLPMGVGLDKSMKLYTSGIGVNGKYIHLGVFDTPEEAHFAYIEAKRRMHA